MKFAFCLFKYFPFSGLSRDFIRILNEARRRGHEAHVFVSEWQGERPEGIEMTVLPTQRWLMNHVQNTNFYRQLRNTLKRETFDAVIGFNKIPGMDIYYGADYCYIGRAVPRYGVLYRLTPRYHHFFTFERAVFGAHASTEILSLSEREKSVYQQYYGTPENRFHLLPPTLDADRRRCGDSGAVRRRMRDHFGIGEDDKLLLFIGSGFKTKGLDRAIRSLAALPDELRRRSSLLVIGQDNPQWYLRLARRLGIEGKVRFLGGRSDIPELLAAGDLLIHPAYSENTGTILLEAITSGLPVLATDVCGYAPYIERAHAGIVLRSPFEQWRLNENLAEMLVSPERPMWRANGLAYGQNPKLYKMPQTAVDIIEKYCRTRPNELNEPLVTTSRGTSLFVREDLARALRGADGFNEIMSIQGEVYREAPGRRTVRFNRGGKQYFLKTHTGVGWQEIMKNLLYFRLPVLGAMNEWHGVHHLHRLGIDTLVIAGYGTTRGNPARRRSFIVTDEIAPSISLEDFCREWRNHPPRGRRPDLRFKRWLIRRVAEIARDMHNSGANHRDFYLCHFLLRPELVDGELCPDASRLYLIDLHRMQIRWRTPTRWAVKDISGLFYSSMDVGLTQRDLFRFMKIYRSRPLREILRSERLFWKRVQSRGRKLYAAEKRRAQQHSTAGDRPAVSGGTLPAGH